MQASEIQLTTNRQGTWRQALVTFFLPILAVLCFRWAIAEPFVIPSGSMIPTLLIHDHMIVNKLSFGLHLPFSNTWLINWQLPGRGQIVVFRYPQNDQVFYIKRVVAVAGDTIELRHGQLWVNDGLIEQGSLDPKFYYSGQDDENQFEYFSEAGHPVRYRKGHRGFADYEKFEVPADSFFVMGDNRDQSSDSRSWGVVPYRLLVGRPLFIWLSCDQALPSAPYICDPSTLRWKRLFSGVQ